MGPLYNIVRYFLALKSQNQSEKSFVRKTSPLGLFQYLLLSGNLTKTPIYKCWTLELGMNQHLVWLVKRSGCTVKSYGRVNKFLSVFSPLSTKKVDLLSNSFYFQATTMLEVEGMSMGLNDAKHYGGSMVSKFNKVKYRSLAIDVTQQGYIYNSCKENGNENRLLNNWISKQLNSKCYYGEAVFVLGPMGAGKTTVLLDEFKKHNVYKDYAYVDTDELMEQLDGFDSDKVEEFYPTARSIAIRLTDWLLNEKISFVAEGTCVKYLELADYMQRLKKNGYVIRVRHVNEIPVEEVLKRTSCRKRKVPKDVVESIYYSSLEGVAELKKMNADNSLFEEI